MVTRNEIKKDCLKVYENLKEFVVRVLELDQSRVAITTDMWTSSHKKRGFMAITAHYVDNNSHIFNLVVQDGLKGIRNTIEKVRESVAYWTATPKRMEKFKETARQLRVTLAGEILAKFNNYWSVVHGVMGVTSVLDPRYKYVMLEYYFPQIYGTSGEYEVEEILDMCRELLRQYEAYGKGGGCRDTTGLVDPNISNDPSLSGYDLYASMQK
ncbi:Unknown protein [Striga hermonthica]|uniref:hAT-like transposase RNase-H fold domain-containing protein n=1 Tax=Striga hermonthica TaxID=68872 RepID=A0A9N7NFH7_STRHE|nr:Unknown protein [Striga hermonthica]